MESIPLPWNSSSAYGGAAIDADDLAGDVGGRRHTQERHHGCDLRRLPGPAQWNFRQKFLLHDSQVCLCSLISYINKSGNP